MLDCSLAHAIRFLSIDAVEKAQSGHPGMPLGMADIATVLWKSHLKYNPVNPLWFNRDRFVLSNGHGSMLLYALLHLTGYAVTIEDLKQFRQLHSKTPGHPECTDTPGVETTTGPLGQGLANAVGMAIAEKNLSAQYNKPNNTLIDHYTYVFAGDGCLMEGISHEVCSLAGTLQLGKLIVFYDDNGISIDGEVTGWFTDDTAMRFRSYGWQVIEAVNGHDFAAIDKAIIEAKQDKRPSLIICKTVIAHGSLHAGSSKTHGAPLGAEDIAQIRKKFNWPYAEFEIPDTLYQAWNHCVEGQALEDAWLLQCHAYKREDETRYFEFLRRINGDLPDNWSAKSQEWIESCGQNQKPIATRKASAACIEFFAPLLPEFFGGSADLTSSNNTNWSKTVPIAAANFDGNYLNYGVREFGMSAIMNGLAVHGGYIPYAGTFLTFCDYARSAVRMSAIMKQRVIYVYTHDSIGLGEDGPTHQPVEHASMLRMTPNMQVWRPADLVETAVAWQQAIQHRFGPSSLLLTRQNLPYLPKDALQISKIYRGGYVLYEPESKLDGVIIATGSEVHLALQAAEALKLQGFAIRVVSMPCAERFLAETLDYQQGVLPDTLRTRLAIEAGATAYWYRFVGLDGAVIGLDSYGASAPAETLFEYYGITVEQVIKKMKELVMEK